MILNKHVSRYCGKCGSNIGKAWQGGNCPNCGCSLEKWGVVVDDTKCDVCGSQITDRELCCSDCGNQMETTPLERSR